MKKIISLVVFFAVLISCGKEIPSVQTDITAPESTEEVKVRTVYLDAEVTRTQIVAEEDVHWSPGDVLDVYVNHAYNWKTQTYGMQKTFSNLSDEVSASTVFKCSDWPETISDYMPNGFAFYPAGLVEYGLKREACALDQSFDPGIYFTLPESQEAVDGSFDPAANLSYAIFNTNDVAEGKANLMFTNMCSLIKITLPSSSDDVKSIQISSPNQLKLAGKIQLYASSALNGGYYYYNNLSYSNSQIPSYSDVTLSKQSGECLTAGETYYAVILSSGNFVSGSKIHDKFDFIFTNKDGYTIKKTLNLQASGSWTPKPSEFISINVSSLPFAAGPSLELNGDTDLVIYPDGSNSASIGVQASHEWTIDYDTKPAWINASVGGSMLTLTAGANNEDAERSGTITIISEGLTKTVTVRQSQMTYEVVSTDPVYQANQLKNGSLYVIANKNTRTYMNARNSQVSFDSHSISSSSLFNGTNVFEYTEDLSKVQTFDKQYRYNSAGTLRSLTRDKYLSSNAKFENDKNNAQYLSVANMWGSDAGGDMDVYYAGTQNSLWINNGTLAFGSASFSSPVERRKWIFYEVRVKED